MGKPLWAIGYNKCCGFAHHRSPISPSDSASHRSRVLFTELPNDYHHIISIIELSVRWRFVEGRGRISRSGLPKTLKWVVVYSSMTFHMNAYQRHRSADYTVTVWGIMSCVCGIAFLCGSTLIEVPLLQAGTVVIWPQMFKSDVKPKHTNKIECMVMHRPTHQTNGRKW